MTSAPINRELAEKGVGALFEEGFKEEAEAINAFLADHAAQAETIKSLSEALQFVMDNGYIKESEHIAQAALSKVPNTGEQTDA